MYLAYGIYLGISSAVTMWVARTLHKNGRSFLVDAFHGNAELADSVNHLLVVGFCLIAVGSVALALPAGTVMEDPRKGAESLAGTAGSLLLVLGIVLSIAHHFLSLCGLRARRRQEHPDEPPVAPDTYSLPGA